ncbi:hypothetical protein [Paractinoplanes atraurantiacus]|uniref:hypothetical protein n=1 Tax=Paractinoplanes atraurantiacus TaxID=1036182 RepID=UPI0015CF553D|nr:hypothetical protein [Actinoplanes atraurantiacus]
MTNPRRRSAGRVERRTNVRPQALNALTAADAVVAFMGVRNTIAPPQRNRRVPDRW